jgi:chromosome partition protein MukF
LKAESGGLTSFDDETLVDAFVQVCDFVEPGADNPRKRATHAIQRLRSQRLLARIDGSSIVRVGEYTLTRLAETIIEFYLQDETLTRENLTILTTALNSSLAQIRAAAQRASSDEDWSRGVAGPLRISVAELVRGIERRQRGLDVQQEGVQQQIGDLLGSDWFASVDHCQALLDETTATLRELNEVLLRETLQMQMFLQEIQQLAAERSLDAEEAVGRVAEQVDRMSGWARDRQIAWSDYYQFVHRFLRDVVRLDPDRALSQRLRDQLAAWACRPFSLVVGSEPSIRLLRPITARGVRPPVVRPRAERELELAAVAPDDAHVDLAARVRAALDAGAHGLAEVTNAVLADMPAVARFLTAGRVAQLVAELTRIRPDHERAWLPVVGEIELEEWRVDARKAPP